MHILIIDDHPLYRDALRSTLQLAFAQCEIAEADSIGFAIDGLRSASEFDLILLDLKMQNVSGFDALIAVRRRFPKIPVLVVSGHDEPNTVIDAMRFGAAGFVSKSSDKGVLIQAIGDVLEGSLAFPSRHLPCSKVLSRPGSTSLAERIANLTPQQFRVLMMIRQGKLNKQIAYELTVGDSTVKAHVTGILRKLGVTSRTQIVIETSSLNFDQPTSIAAEAT